MDSWADALVAASAVLAAFFAVMGLRGLIEAFDELHGHCAACGRVTALPVPLRRRECWHCRHQPHQVRQHMARH